MLASASTHAAPPVQPGAGLAPGLGWVAQATDQSQGFSEALRRAAEAGSAPERPGVGQGSDQGAAQTPAERPVPGQPVPVQTGQVQPGQTRTGPSQLAQAGMAQPAPGQAAQETAAQPQPILAQTVPTAGQDVPTGAPPLAAQARAPAGAAPPLPGA
ncbi:hypothetical protein, partial [Rhodovarius lipocyclicus]